MNKLFIVHKKLLFLHIFSQGAEDLKARYTLVEAKVVTFKMDYFRLRKVVELHRYPLTSVSRITELEKKLEEKKHGTYHMEIELKISSSASQNVMSKLGEKNTAQSKELGVLQEEHTTSRNKLQDISEDDLKEDALHNVLCQLESLMQHLYDFHNFFSFI